MDLLQSLWQCVARLGANYATLDQGERIAAVPPNYSVARYSGSGIDPEDDYRLGVTHYFLVVISITPLSPPSNPNLPDSAAL